MDERMNNIMNHILAIGLTLVLSLSFGMLATGILPSWLISVICFLLGWNIPTVILKVIGKEDTEESKSE
jgi:uncharacterized membrane protein AbrB (regulator of aidB expression)